MTVREGEETVATLQVTPVADSTRDRPAGKGVEVLSKLAGDGRWAVELRQVHGDGTMHFHIIELPQED